jgi:hypothetical protein
MAGWHTALNFRVDAHVVHSSGQNTFARSAFYSKHDLN